MHPPGIYPGTAPSGFTQPGLMQPPGIAMPFSSPQEEAEGIAEGNQNVALRLRGLPYQCTEQDIYAFFAKHEMVEHIADVPKAVKLIQKANGKASGQAIVEMASKEAADLARIHINGQWMGTRYVEVFFNDVFEQQQPQEGVWTEQAEQNYGNINAMLAAMDEPMEVPCVSDIGGTGGTPDHAMSVHPATVPWQAGMQPWGGPRLNHPDFIAAASASRAEAMARQSAGGTGDAMLKDGQEGSWESLFAFLTESGQTELRAGSRNAST
jgi:hypothetical protein